MSKEKKRKVVENTTASPFILPTTNPNLCYCNVTNEFQGESTLCNLSECQGTPCSK